MKDFLQKGKPEFIQELMRVVLSLRLPMIKLLKHTLVLYLSYYALRISLATAPGQRDGGDAAVASATVAPRP